MWETREERRGGSIPPWYRPVKLAILLAVMLTCIIYLLRVKAPSRTTNPVLIQSAP